MRHVVPVTKSALLVRIGEILVDAWSTELRRGSVELCVLAVLQNEEGYGYEIIERLRSQAELDVSESTIYPILARLSKEQLLDVRLSRSSQGPPRRYFRLNADGKRRLTQMTKQWMELQSCVSKLLAPSNH